VAVCVCSFWQQLLTCDFRRCLQPVFFVHAAGYEQCQGKLLRLLERLVYLREITPDYTYYGIASPWLQV
jgi:hypothetical protein